VTGIGNDGEGAVGAQQANGMVQAFKGAACGGGDGFVTAGQVTQVEGDGAYLAVKMCRDPCAHESVAACEQGADVVQSCLFQALLGCHDRRSLDIEAKQVTIWLYEPGEKQRVVPVSQGGVDYRVAGADRFPQGGMCE